MISQPLIISATISIVGLVVCVTLGFLAGYLLKSYLLKVPKPPVK